MKTLTEFNGFQIKQALEKKKALGAEGKSPEETQAGLAEAFKLEGDKLKYFLAMLEQAEKRPDGIKRVIILQPAEGESAPAGAIAGDGFVMMAEFYPLPQAPQKAGRDRDERGGRGGRDGKRGKGRGGRDGKGGGRGGDRDRGGERGARGPRGPRGEGGQGPRAESAPVQRPPGAPGIVKKPANPATGDSTPSSGA